MKTKLNDILAIFPPIAFVSLKGLILYPNLEDILQTHVLKECKLFFNAEQPACSILFFEEKDN